ncbi:Uncharacterised protein [Mycobacterium tuberculosis]|uniref:Uncharacterized protein n=1 Tax=Mycobacterium tuberculosis TaxID=1773 RepID=A0A0U0QTY6_MYCTX|nr:Uncharacterised protein [Mycobacterium tuberculosis]
MVSTGGAITAVRPCESSEVAIASTIGAAAVSPFDTTPMTRGRRAVLAGRDWRSILAIARSIADCSSGVASSMSVNVSAAILHTTPSRRARTPAERAAPAITPRSPIESPDAISANTCPSGATATNRPESTI